MVYPSLSQNELEKMNPQERAVYAITNGQPFDNFTSEEINSGYNWISENEGGAMQVAPTDWEWGNSNNPSNNNEFYATQFGNLLNQDQNYRDANQIAKTRAKYPEQQKDWDATNTDWSWLNEDIFGSGPSDINVVTENDIASENVYSLRYGLTPESTRRDIMDAVHLNSPDFKNETDQNKYQSWASDPGLQEIDWAGMGSPREMFVDVDPEQLTYENQKWIQRMIDDIYIDNGSQTSTTSPGYASPSGYNNTTAGGQ
tara:strand:+ start:648 stop:1418 length:771 start_codon:yes stop_codon:yes gene_type:complete